MGRLLLKQRQLTKGYTAGENHTSLHWQQLSANSSSGRVEPLSTSVIHDGTAKGPIAHSYPQLLFIHDIHNHATSRRQCSSTPLHSPVLMPFSGPSSTIFPGLWGERTIDVDFLFRAEHLTVIFFPQHFDQL